ncbi:MAG: hypothetical protein MZW92_59360 [Comamonadaceae bacterium]|nr:hypothetical protein [Comamonadaceae bacterium]
MLFDYAQLGASSERMRMTTDGAVVAGVQTHVFTDTVTLQSGFTAESVFDANAAPPGNPFATGRDTITLNGRIESVAAGGSFTLTTSSPLIDYVVDDYPSAGALRLQGKTGTMLLTALSAQDVRIELDADGNGSFEHVHGDLGLAAVDPRRRGCSA